MIKLSDLLKEVEEAQVEEGRFGNIVTGLGMTAASVLGGGAKAQTKAPVDSKPATTQTVASKPTAMNPNDPADVKNVDSNYMKWSLGTSDDGILGQYTSQFKFPHARLKVDNKIINLGLKDNTTLDIISNFDKGKMDQWNKFVDWMEASKIDGKKISGNPELDKDPNIGLDVIDAYKETPAGKNFWVSGEDDIKEVQRFIKAYRDYTIADWKAGAKDPKGVHPDIELRKL